MEKVLVIDDSLSVRVALERILRRRPVEVVTASTGMNGVAAMLEMSPSLVICDLVLPDRDGISLARFVRQHPLLKSIPFVLISGAVDEETAEKAQAAGCEAVLTKPFSSEAVLALLDRFLGGKGLSALASTTESGDAALPEEAQAPGPAPTPGPFPLQILVVDDSRSVRAAIERILSREGYQTTSVGSAADAIRRLESDAFDLLISDVVMPDMDGTEITRFVREHPGLKELPVILVSGLTDAEIEERARKAGADGIVRKPFTAETLLPIVNRLSRKRRARLPAPPVSPPAPEEEEPAQAAKAPAAEADLARQAFLQIRTVTSVQWAMLVNGEEAGGIHSIGLEAGRADEPARRLSAILPSISDLGTACGRKELQSGVLEYGDGFVVFMTCPGRRLLAVSLSDARQLGLVRFLLQKRVRPLFRADQGRARG